MLLTRLPPQFLLPAWNARQLVALQQRAYKSDDNGFFFRKTMSDVIPTLKNKAQAQSPTPDEKSRDGQSHTPSQKPSVLSLFEELFPEESQTKWRAAQRREDAERREQSERLPAFQWWQTGQRDMSERVDRDAGTKKRKNGFREEQPSGYLSLRRTEEGGGSRSRGRENPSILILNSATKTLEESDFFRLSPKGEHIEGWTSGIIKVIPGRDSNTLRPLGHYFILFSDDASAKAYLDNIFRIWRLAKHKGRWVKSGVAGLPLPPGLLTPGDDVQKVIRGFTITPAWNKLFLRMATKPYRPSMQRLIADGGPAAIAGRKSKTENMVLVSTDIGQVSLADLLNGIKRDGRLRNLHWKLANVEDPITRLQDWSDGEDKAEKLRAEKETDGKLRRRPKPLGKYVVSFKDRHEARRFVREWHKRPFVKRADASRRLGQESPPIINAEILW